MVTDIDALDWDALGESLRTRGWAATPPLVTPATCDELRATYADTDQFRSRVVMARYRFGEGEYQYFANPLPPVILDLRRRSYRHLAGVATWFHESLGIEETFPFAHESFIDRCHAHGQTRPTPLLLRYTEGGYNCLHQDVYGPVHFPLQMVVMLSRPEVDYEGGHFLLVETRPRAQSAGEAIRPEQGAAVIFTTRHRPVRGARGFYRATVRHGVSTVTRGERYTLGIIYHDAE